ncbi:MAG: replicative DNA helicase [Prevotella sp.]|nr:replicative DNA helicase [Prevotella sp.]
MSENKRKDKQKNTPLDLSLCHLQPQAPEIEKAVLGALMIDKEAYPLICETLRPESFYEPRHQIIFDAVRQLSIKDEPIDVLTVTEQLARMGELDHVGGPGYIAELSSRVATSANVEYYSDIVAQKNLSRQLISYTSTIGTKAYDETNDVNDVIQEAERLLFDIAQTNMKKDYVHINPLIKEAEKILMTASSNNGDVTGISTGYYKLDDITSGWQKSDFIIIAGRPAMGKTAFALSMAKNIAADLHKPMAFFSLEMSGVQLTNRLISNACEIDGKKILNGQLDRNEWDRFDKRIGNLIDAPLYIDDTPGLSIFELRTKARRLVREHQIELIMIDYLQLMNANGMRFSSRQEEVSTISRSLKGLAKELDIPIIALSQLNRGVEGREGVEGKRPLLSDLRESGAIEQDADMVLFVHRPEYYHLEFGPSGEDYRGMAEIIIAKHRKGATDIVLLKFRGEYTRFENPEDNMLENHTPFSGEIMGSKINGEEHNFPFPPQESYKPF